MRALREASDGAVAAVHPEAIIHCIEPRSAYRQIDGVRVPDGGEMIAGVRALIESYNDAWNRQDLDSIHAAHSDGVGFHNDTADERVEGADAVRAHIARIFENWPTLRFTGRSLRVADDFAISEWTARGERDANVLEWDGVEVFPVVDGRIARKDVYSTSFKPRIASGTSPSD